MKISVKLGTKGSFDQDLAVFFVSDDAKDQKAQIERLGGITGGVAAQLWDQKLASAKHNQMFVSPTFGKMSPRLIGMAGLGKYEKLTPEHIRLIGGTIAKQAKGHKAKTVVIDLGALVTKTVNAQTASRALTEGLLLGNYEYQEYKSAPEEKTVAVAEVVLVTDGQVTDELKKAVSSATLEAEAVMFARDLVNHPPAHLHPKTLKEAAERIAKDSNGAVTIKVYDREKLKKMGAGAILGVAQGSEFEPFLVHLHYKPTKSKKSIALVGKGVTFDSGGLSIKDSKNMEDMKMDMAGAAVVLGVFSHLPAWKPNVQVHGIFAAVENMPSDRALRVGDVVKTMSGKTVEVLNTDAEGRLILADALHYAENQNPDAIVDFATLTGACMVALGDQIAGLFTKDTNLATAFLQLSAITGEKLCQLPLTEEYEQELESHVADLQNVGKGRYGGAITAALFLQHFVKKTPWAHFDIAGPAFNRASSNSYTPAGSTGFGVRTILHWLRSL